LDFSVDSDENLELDDSESFDNQELGVDDSCEFELETSFDYNDETDDQEESLENRLASIAIKHHLSGAALRSITDLLISLGHKIHKDRRTILKTPREKLDSNSFQHFGLMNGLNRKLRSGLVGTDFAELQFSIDGLPLCKSATTVFWPILCRVKNANDCSPFPVSVHCGNGGKPPDLNFFLEPLIKELKFLEENGIDVNGEIVWVKSIAFICDAPAREFVRGTVGHTSNHGCERCAVVGVTKMKRRVFQSLNARLRTNDSFRAQRDKQHHKQQTPLLNLAFDIVKCFPLDYMHLTCLGTFKRFLTII
jgi:hypothetical protein